MRKAKGFTLIEVICVLIIVGLLGAGLTVGFTFAASRHQAMRNDYQQAQKIQVAVTRISYELKNASGLSVAGNQASYTLGTAKSIYASNGRIILSNNGTEHVLTDNVSSLTMTYSSNLLRLTFQTRLASGNTFRTDLYLNK